MVVIKCISGPSTASKFLSLVLVILSIKLIEKLYSCLKLTKSKRKDWGASNEFYLMHVF